jgi:MFS family permease
MNPFQSAPSIKKTLTLFSIFLGSLITTTHAMSASTLLPLAAAEIGGMDIFTLTSTLNGAVATLLMAVYGFFIVRRPALQPILLTVSFFLAAASLIVRAFAPSMEVVVLTGVTYAAISGGIFICGLSMVRQMYETEKAGLYLGMVTTFSSIGLLAGPLVLGAIADFLGWRASVHVLWVLALIAALMALFGLRLSKKDDEALAKTGNSIDALGIFGVIVFSIPAILFITLGSSRIPFGTPLSWGLLAVAIVGLILVIMSVSTKKEKAIFSTGALKDRSTLLVTAYLTAIGFASMAVSYFVATYILKAMGLPAWMAGLATTLTSILPLFLGPILGKYIAKTGNGRAIMAGGSAVLCILLVAFIVLIKPDLNIYVIFALMLGYGIFVSVMNVSGFAVPQLVIRADIRVASNSFIQFVKTFGTAMGTAVFGVFITVFGVVDGIKPAFITALIVGVLSLVIALFITKPSEDKSSEDKPVAVKEG